MGMGSGVNVEPSVNMAAAVRAAAGEGDEFDQMADRARSIMCDAGREISDLAEAMQRGTLHDLSRRYSELEDAVQFAERLIAAARTLGVALRDLQADQLNQADAANSRMGTAVIHADRRPATDNAEDWDFPSATGPVPTSRDPQVVASSVGTSIDGERYR